MKHRSKGRVLQIAGIILIVCAIILSGYNIIDDLFINNHARDIADTLQEERNTDTSSDYQLHPDKEMREIMIDGVAYIGTIQIPDIDIDLPVVSELTDENMKIAPCRYTGSVYQNDMVIGEHNYASSFGKLNQLDINDTVIFIDNDSNIFQYQVTSIEILYPQDVDEMIHGDWDLTLFSCGDIRGSTRITIRCDLVS